MEPLDPQDQALILALQEQPRARAVQLGEVLGMSAPSVSNRLATLRERGAIEVVGMIDYRSLPGPTSSSRCCAGSPRSFSRHWANDAVSSSRCTRWARGMRRCV